MNDSQQRRRFGECTRDKLLRANLRPQPADVILNALADGNKEDT